MPRDSIDENDLFFGVLDAMWQRDEAFNKLCVRILQCSDVSA